MPDLSLTSSYDYDLPLELIAAEPLPQRSASRMLVIDRKTGELEHRTFSDFPDLIGPGDLVVLNDSRVLKARVFSADGRIEFLFLEEVAPLTWLCLAKPGRKLQIGTIVELPGTRAEVTAILPAGERIIRLEHPIDFDCVGVLPLPPYMGREAVAADDSRYQTVYAREAGSVAAPTAGLHFTDEILQRVPHAQITLHVGQGTFQPVKAENIAKHAMHEERYTISGDAADTINQASRIVAIGTTTTRVLESQPPGPIQPHSGRTSIFIHPPKQFHRVGALLTNFHLPKSTLLMLVCAFAGYDTTLRAYKEAIRLRYRFYSYGDCMLIH